MHLVLNFNTEEDSEEWNINHNEKCDPGGVNFGILRLMATLGTYCLVAVLLHFEGGDQQVSGLPPKWTRGGMAHGKLW